MGAKDFEVLNRLGEGSFSSVWKVRRFSDGKEYAMKKVRMSALSDKEKENALNEVRILASIRSPYIIRYKEAFFDDNSMSLCIIMEFAASGDLYSHIERRTKSHSYFTEQEIWQTFIQVLNGLKVLHDHRILHRDLKSANIFLGADSVVKLGDLNVSKVAKNNLAYTQAGTPYYAAPEVWRDKPYDAKSDIWSLGCVIYEMAALKPPFLANDIQGLYKKIQRGIFERIPSQYSAGLFNMISWCLQKSPTSRPSCNQLLNSPLILRHMQENCLTLSPEAGSLELLGTIRIPKNMRALSNQLPKADYNELEVSQEQKEERLSDVSAASLDKRKKTLHQRGKSPLIYNKEQPILSERVRQATPTNPPQGQQGRLPPIIIMGRKNRLVRDPLNYPTKNEVVGQSQGPKKEEETGKPYPMQRNSPQNHHQNPLLAALMPKYKAILHQRKTPQVNQRIKRANSFDSGRIQNTENQPQTKLMPRKPAQGPGVQPVRFQRRLSNSSPKTPDQDGVLKDKAFLPLNADKPAILRKLKHNIPLIDHNYFVNQNYNGSSAIANAIAQRNPIIVMEQRHQVNPRIERVRPIWWD